MILFKKLRVLVNETYMYIPHLSVFLASYRIFFAMTPPANSVTLFHNPKCSKSRATLQLLQDEGVEPHIVEYLKTPPDAEMLGEILQKLAMDPRDLMRKKEQAYAANNLADATLAPAQLINAMIENPILIERPIFLANGKAAIGRPPESVLEIL